MSMLEESLLGVLSIKGWVTTIFCNMVLLALIAGYVVYEVEWEGRDVMMPFPQSTPRKVK